MNILQSKVGDISTVLSINANATLQNWYYTIFVVFYINVTVHRDKISL
jgi:hypothetical protein